MAIKIIIHVLLLFFIETIGQVLYYSIRIKFFNEFYSYDSIGSIFFDSLYFIGTVKAAFYLPVYLIYHFYYSKSNMSRLRVSLYHSIIFLGLSIFFNILLPWGVLRNIYDVLFLTLISFLSSLITFGNKWRRLKGASQTGSDA